jgi:uncharacterized protein
MRATSIFMLLLLVSSFTLPVNAVNNSNVTMNIIYIGYNIGHDSFTGGNISKNIILEKYIPNTDITDQIISIGKLGTPMVTIGNGSEPKVMIVAGVHGNELPAQIAAIEMINYLKNKNINGTVYIIPVVNPQGTSQNMRLWNGENLNSVANNPRTPTNTIIKYAKHLGVNMIGDFHSTQPGSYPGNYSVLCSKDPVYKSYDMGIYISNQTSSTLISYDRAGVDYPGAVEDMSNLEGIPSVTCEVLSPHGTANKETIKRSFNQMLSFLKYGNIIN